MNALPPILSLSILGAVFGLGLAYASMKLAVQEDPRLKEVAEALPGLNCGACGAASCHAFAEGLLKGERPVNGCLAGGSEVAEKLASVLGVEAEVREKKVATIHCGANSSQRKRRAEYDGILTCRAAELIVGGELACTYSCLGYGDCARICPFDAIEMQEGLPRVDLNKCTACGLCVNECPRGIISLEPYHDLELIVVACSNREKGPAVKKICPVGCTACKICEKNSKDGVFKVEGNLAIIDYKKATAATDWDICIEKCPTRCIVKIKEVEK